MSTITKLDYALNCAAVEIDTTNARAELAALRADLKQAVSDWRGLRDAVFGKDDHPCENRAMVELEANNLRTEVTALQQAVNEVIDRMIELEEFRKRDNGDVIWTATGDIFLMAHPAPEQVTP